jgi:hypothetical protein
MFGPSSAVAASKAAMSSASSQAATSCLDRSLRRPHLGGSLGHAVLVGFEEQGLVDVDCPSRTLTINTRRRKRLTNLLPGLTDRVRR